MLDKEFEKNREDILENEFCMQSDASTLPFLYLYMYNWNLCTRKCQNKNGFSRIYYTST